MHQGRADGGVVLAEAGRPDEGDVLFDPARGDEVVGLADDEVVGRGGVEIHRELTRFVGGFAIDDRERAQRGVVGPREHQLGRALGGDGGAVGLDRLHTVLRCLDEGDRVGDTVDGVDLGDQRLVERQRLTEVGGGADQQVGLAGDLFGQVPERRPKAVGQDETGDDETDAEHHREGGHREPGLVGSQVAEGQAEHGLSPCSRSAFSRVPSSGRGPCRGSARTPRRRSCRRRGRRHGPRRRRRPGRG